MSEPVAFPVIAKIQTQQNSTLPTSGSVVHNHPNHGHSHHSHHTHTHGAKNTKSPKKEGKDSHKECSEKGVASDKKKCCQKDDKNKDQPVNSGDQNHYVKAMTEVDQILDKLIQENEELKDSPPDELKVVKALAVSKITQLQHKALVWQAHQKAQKEALEKKKKEQENEHSKKDSSALKVDGKNVITSEEKNSEVKVIDGVKSAIDAGFEPMKETALKEESKETTKNEKEEDTLDTSSTSISSSTSKEEVAPRSSDPSSETNTNSSEKCQEDCCSTSDEIKDTKASSDNDLKDSEKGKVKEKEDSLENQRIFMDPKFLLPPKGGWDIFYLVKTGLLTTAKKKVEKIENQTKEFLSHCRNGEEFPVDFSEDTTRTNPTTDRNSFLKMFGVNVDALKEGKNDITSKDNQTDKLNETGEGEDGNKLEASKTLSQTDASRYTGHMFNVDEFVANNKTFLEAFKDGADDESLLKIVTGAYLNVFDQTGATIMHYAAKKGCLSFVKWLERKGAPMYNHSKDNAKMTPLHWACTEGHLAVIHFLVIHAARKYNVDLINSVDALNCTPLLIAAQYGHMEVCLYLIKKGANPAHVDSSKDTALHWGAYKGNIHIVQLLHYLAPDTLNIPDAYGQTPLHLAAMRGNYEVVEYLVVDCKIDPFLAKDGKDFTPYALAVSKNSTVITKFMEYNKHDKLNWETLTDVTFYSRFCSKLFSKSVGFRDPGGDVWPFYFDIAAMLMCSIAVPVKLVDFNATAVSVASGFTYNGVHVGIILLVISLVIMWISFLLTWLSNPGYITEEVDDHAYSKVLDIFTHDKKFDDLVCSTIEKEEASDAMALMQGSKIMPKFKLPPLCHSCKIQKWKRSKHCRTCRKCCREFDHHCPFVNNCVGALNYKYFIVYIVSMSIAQTIYAVLTIMYMSKVGWDTLLGISVIIVCVMMLMAWSMVSYHSDLLATNLTTNEHINSNRYENFKDPVTGKFRNPYDKKNVLKNCEARCFPVAAEEMDALRLELLMNREEIENESQTPDQNGVELSEIKIDEA